MMGTAARGADDISASPANRKVTDGEAGRTLDGDTGDATRMSGCSSDNVNRPVLSATHDDGLIGNAFHETTFGFAHRHRNASISPMFTSSAPSSVR
jgi:hypothetical protein